MGGEGVEQSNIRGCSMLSVAAGMGSEHACGILGFANAEGRYGCNTCVRRHLGRAGRSLLERCTSAQRGALKLRVRHVETTPGHVRTGKIGARNGAFQKYGSDSVSMEGGWSGCYLSGCWSP